MALNYSFSGKKVLVTGGGSGIGRQLVQKLYQDGAFVFTIDKNPESISTLCEEFPDGDRLTAEVADITDWEGTKKILEEFGVMDHLVNNAGVFIPAPFMDLTEQDLTKLYKVNVFGMVNVSQVVAKKMIEARQSGSIVNVSSMSANVGLPLLSGYASTKAAISNLTKTMAVELGTQNIRVNAVLPNLVETPLLSELPSEMVEGIPAFLERNVIKRLVKPEEVADLILFLLSPHSEMVVGQSLVIDGGFSIS